MGEEIACEAGEVGRSSLDMRVNTELVWQGEGGVAIGSFVRAGFCVCVSVSTAQCLGSNDDKPYRMLELDRGVIVMVGFPCPRILELSGVQHDFIRRCSNCETWQIIEASQVAAYWQSMLLQSHSRQGRHGGHSISPLFCRSKQRRSQKLPSSGQLRPTPSATARIITSR